MSMERRLPATAPEEIRNLRRWVCWKAVWDESRQRFRKPPHSPLDGSAIGATEKHAAHFATFDEALAGAAVHSMDGVGLVFLEGDCLAGVDFDDCRRDGATQPEVLLWLRWFPTYAEVSPSRLRRARHLQGQAREGPHVHAARRHRAKVEMYSSNRYFTFTGERIGGAGSVADCQAGLDKLRAHLEGGTGAAGPAPDGRPMPPSLARRFHSENMEALRRAPEGRGNELLNATAFFAARAIAALGKTEDELKAEILAVATKEWKNPHPEAGARATIDSGWRSGAAQPIPMGADGIPTGPGQVREMTKRSEEVLHSIGLKYFERNSELVTTAYGREAPEVKGIDRAEDSVIIKVASHQTIVRDLDSRATYVKETAKGDVPVHVPQALPGHIHDRVHSEPRDVPFPTLEMVTASPALLPSGAVTRGLFEEGVLFVPRDRRSFPAVPDRPTRGKAEEAMREFDEVFREFPFVDPGREAPWRGTASYSVALAAVLSLVARPCLGIAAIPLMAVSAPTRRSGKTKIVEAASAAALGHRPTAVHYTDEEELGKHLQPLMRAGDRAVLLDNIELPLKSSKLCILITGGVLRDRVLGESRDVALRNHASFFATGNNLVIGGDLAARALRCDIDPGVERPEARRFGFDPAERAAERHPRLVASALTALRAYIAAGCPWAPDRAAWGGFEKWDKLVSGCLAWLGFADPCAARERILESDPVRSANADILESWHAAYGGNPVSLRRIRDDKGDVCEALLKDGHWDGHWAKWVLRRLEGQVVGGYRLERLEGRSVFRVIGPDGKTGASRLVRKGWPGDPGLAF